MHGPLNVKFINVKNKYQFKIPNYMMFGGRDILVCIATRLRAGRSRVRIPQIGLKRLPLNGTMIGMVWPEGMTQETRVAVASSSGATK